MTPPQGAERARPTAAALGDALDVSTRTEQRRRASAGLARPVGRPASSTTVRVSFRWPAALVARVDALAEARGATRSAVVLAIIERETGYICDGDGEGVAHLMREPVARGIVAAVHGLDSIRAFIAEPVPDEDVERDEAIQWLTRAKAASGWKGGSEGDDNIDRIFTALRTMSPSDRLAYFEDIDRPTLIEIHGRVCGAVPTLRVRSTTLVREIIAGGGCTQTSVRAGSIGRGRGG